MATAKKAAAKTTPARKGPAKTSTHTPRGLEQDRAKVATGQKYELEYEAGKLGVTPAVVKKAAKKVGPSRKKIEIEIKGGKV